MKKLVTIALISMSCCATEKKQNEVVTEATTKQVVNNEFLEYVSLLPKIELPFEANCENCCDHLARSFENELFEKFKPEGSNIAGLVEKANDRVVILVTYPADIIMPSIKVYDLSGKLTGEMNFMTSYCGADFGYYGTQYFKIDRDISLTEIDTSYYMTMDSLDYHIIDTTKIEVTRKDFRINAKGEIVEVN